MVKTTDRAGQGSVQTRIKIPAIQQWAPALHRWFGQDLPRDYLAWDSESTGFKKDWDIPVEFGWCVVRDCKPTHRGSFFLDWTRYPQLVDEYWLDEQMNGIADSMAQDGRTWHITTALLRERGRDPFKVLQFAQDLFTANREAGATFVGHNTLTYDNELWYHVFREWQGIDWQWFKSEQFDTGCMEKALLTQSLAPNKQLSPNPGESFYDFQIRCKYAHRPGIKWNVEACVDRYKLCERFGVCREDLHGAKADAYCCHLLLETHREALRDD